MQASNGSDLGSRGRYEGGSKSMLARKPNLISKEFGDTMEKLPSFYTRKADDLMPAKDRRGFSKRYK